MADLPNVARELYGLPLDDFTTVRNDLARKVSREGGKAAAETIRKLRKPRVSMWALNQAVRREPGLVEELLEANRSVAEARRPQDLRAATAARRDVVTRLERAAERVLQEAGKGSAGAAQEVVQTLFAVGEEQGRDELTNGTFVEPLEASAFGFGLDLAVEAEPALHEEGQASARAEREAAQRRFDEAEARVRDKERGVQQARADLEAAESELASAERERDRARKELEKR